MSSLRDRLIQVTGGRYAIEEELGRGGMAVVFAATDLRLKRAVAIKALPPDLAFRADVRSRFIREAQMVAGLSHPHIVPIYAVDEADGLVWMVMGRVRGMSLAQRLHRDGRMAFGEVRRVMRETADALAHAHSHGVIHRDIKPDNILLDEKTGRVLVTDFGIARALQGDQRLTATGVAVGTPTYMSPEQARGDDDVDGRADVYALGVVGFQMLAGEPPFAAPNTPALLLKHLSESPPPLTARRPDVPSALEYAVERALAKDRSARWPSATALRDALADDAPAPPMRAGEWGLNARVEVAARPGAAPAASVPAQVEVPELPPYPVWRGGDRAEHDRWRDAQRAWRDQVRAQQSAYTDASRAARDAARNAGQEARRREAEARKGASIADRVRGLQRHVVSNVFVMLLLFVINASTGGPPWFLFPVFAMSIGIAVHILALWQDGVRFGEMFSRPALLRTKGAAQQLVSADPAGDTEARARALVGADVLAGSHGSAMRRAIDDERAVQEILRALGPADRAQLPDIEPTLRSLVERVASLAQALHRLDADIRPEQMSHVDARLAEARAVPADTAGRDRRISLLERQQVTLKELAERRGTLANQLDSASLVLHTMRLDLLRLRSAGIASAAGETSSVTQEARALSRDIGRVLDAAAEVRKM